MIRKPPHVAPFFPQLSIRLEKLIVAIVTICIFIIYRITASPTIGWVDSGVIAAASHTLGIPNPPGFPLYLLIANLFTKIPFGSVVFRLELLSELSAVGIALLVFVFVKKFTSFFPAISAMIVTAFSYTIWQQANNVETYTLTNVVLFGLVAWAIRIAERNQQINKPASPAGGSTNQQILFLGLCSGFALGLNPTVAVLAAFAVTWMIWNRRVVKEYRWAFIGAIVLCIIGAIAIYSYLPIRASSHPFVNWGDPSTPERIRAHLFGSGLNIYEPETNSINGFTGQPVIFWQSFLHYLKLALFQLTPLLFPLVILGGWVLFQKNRQMFFLFLSLVIANMAGVILYFGGNQESWMITSWVVFAVFFGIGSDTLLNRMHPLGRMGFFAFIAASLIPLFFWYPVLNHSKQRYADEYAKILYRNVPQGSIIVGGGDFFNSLTAYTHEVTGERRDIVPITGNMFYIFPWYRENLRKNTDITISKKIDELIKFKKVEEFTEAIDQLVEDNPTRAVFVTPLLLRDSVVAGTSEGTYKTKTYALVPHGLLLRVDSLTRPAKPDEALYEFPVYDTLPYYMERNYTNALRLLVNDYAVALGQLGEYFMQANNLEKAYEYFSRSLAAGTKDSVEFLHRIAIFYAQTGKINEAKKAFTSALTKDPENKIIERNYQIFLSQSASSSSSLSLPPDASSSGKLNKTTSSGLSFSLPPDFEMRESGGKTILSPKEKSSGFQIEIQILTRSARESIDAFITKQPLPSGAKLLEQGQAKIPNVDIAFVRVLSLGDSPRGEAGKSTLEFFLFQANIVIHILVSPSDSPLMRVFDEIVTSMKI